MLAEEPAAAFGLSGKGRIAPGNDADLVLFDPEVNWMLDDALIQTKYGWSAYQGWTFTGAIERTFRRGRTVFDRRGGRPWFGEPDGIWLDAGQDASGTADRRATSRPQLVAER